MSLREKLDSFKANFESGGPPYNMSREAIDTMHAATEELLKSGIIKHALKAGDRAADFILTDYQGKLFDSRKVRQSGPLVIGFYRGVW